MLRRARLSAVIVVAAACGADPGTAPSPSRFPPERDFLAEVDRTRGTRDAFTPLREPDFVPADRAAGVSDDETVLGLDLGSVQAAYPVQVLNHHEIVEHRLAGIELLACW